MNAPLNFTIPMEAECALSEIMKLRFSGPGPLHVSAVPMVASSPVARGTGTRIFLNWNPLELQATDRVVKRRSTPFYQLQPSPFIVEGVKLSFLLLQKS